jgi:hypothetical protein
VDCGGFGTAGTCEDAFNRFASTFPCGQIEGLAMAPHGIFHIRAEVSTERGRRAVRSSFNGYSRR